jgi:hypothetical protein
LHWYDSLLNLAGSDPGRLLQSLLRILRHLHLTNSGAGRRARNLKLVAGSRPRRLLTSRSLHGGRCDLQTKLYNSFFCAI